MCSYGRDRSCIVPQSLFPPLPPHSRHQTNNHSSHYRQRQVVKKGEVMRGHLEPRQYSRQSHALLATLRHLSILRSGRVALARPCEDARAGEGAPRL